MIAFTKVATALGSARASRAPFGALAERLFAMRVYDSFPSFPFQHSPQASGEAPEAACGAHALPGIVAERSLKK